MLVSAGWGAMVRWLLHPNRVRRNTRLASVLRVTTHADGDCLVFIGRRPMPLRRAPQPATAPLFEFPMLLRRRTAAALYAIVCTQLLQHAHAVYLSALPDVRRSRTLLITSTLTSTLYSSASISRLNDSRLVYPCGDLDPEELRASPCLTHPICFVYRCARTAHSHWAGRFRN